MHACVARVTYTDGQTAIIGKDQNYDAIDRSRLSLFEITNAETGQVHVKLNMFPGQRLIWRRRIAQKGPDQTVAHIIGKQLTVNGTNKQGILVFFENDGSLEVMDRFEEGHAFLSSFQLLPNEQWE